ncbi:MAG: hypothetical protein K6A15_01130 [Treponema sp.]|nr:hypothetical protein [Treponema sp.]
MKKIVGILAAAAVLATSVFAADVSAATKIKGEVLKYDGSAESFKLFKEGNDSHEYAQPNITFSISDDKAGAEVKLSSDGGTKEVKLVKQTIWFKPVDVFKVTVGNFDVALNKEKIKWTESVTGLGGNGILLSLNVSGFGLDAGFTANEAYWLESTKADPIIKQFFLKAGYSADFGTIAGYIEFNRSGRRTYAFHDALFNVDQETTGTEWYVDPADGQTKSRTKKTTSRVPAFAVNTGAISDIHFGAGYANNFNGIDMFVNVAGYMGKEFNWVRPEFYIGGNVDAFGYQAFVAPVIFLGTVKPDPAVALEIVAKLTYQLEPCKIYAQFYDSNVMTKKFVSTIELGAEGSCGVANWKIWAQIDTKANDKVDIAVPFELSVNF